jgi:uncharacterized integral membrane protein
VKLLSWLIGLPLAAIVVLFALSNRQGVAIGLWPFEEGLVLPVYLAVLMPFFAGLLLGLCTAGIRGLSHRRAARVQSKRAAALERELAASRVANSANRPAEASPPAGNPTVPS